MTATVVPTLTLRLRATRLLPKLGLADGEESTIIFQPNALPRPESFQPFKDAIDAGGLEYDFDPHPTNEHLGRLFKAVAEIGEFV